MLPINAYELTTEQVLALGRARTHFVGQCMRDFGFTFDERVATQGEDQVIANQVMDFGVFGNKRRYGVIDRDIAAKYGYHLISSVSGAIPQRNPDDPHGLGAMTPAKGEVLYGKTADGRRLTHPVNGKSVPPDGCLGAATKRLAELGDPGQHGLPADIKRDSFARAENDAAVRAVFDEWSTCMKAKGYTYSRPGAAGTGFDVSSKTVSAREIAAAVADVECKTQYDVVGVWAGFEVRYQNEQIEQHAEELAAIKTANEQLLKNLASAVGQT